MKPASEARSDGNSFPVSSDKKLILGFDAGCSACSDVAERIQWQVGDKLSVRNLRDPEVMRWREQALGDHAPWTPTLFEINGGTVRAWTGIRMGVRLSRTLGPLTTWRVMQVFGETDTTPSLAGSAAVNAVMGLTRGQFLKGVGGAVLAMSMLSGTRSLAAPARAEEHWLAQLSFTSSKELSEKQAAATWAQLTRGRHLRRLLSSGGLDDNLAARRIRGRMLSAPKTGVTSSSKAIIKGVSHQLKGGGRLLALVYQEDDALIVSYRLDGSGRNTRLFSRVLEDETEETVRVLSEAEDGDVLVASGSAVDNSESARTVQAQSCRGGCPTCCPCGCVSASKRCLFNCCAPCALSCLNVWTCIGCVLIWCPACASVNRCCYRRGCRCRPNCGK